MTTATRAVPRTALPEDPLGPFPIRHSVGRNIVGGFFLVMGGVHLGLVSADPEAYSGFADRGLFPFVRDGWDQIVMAEPVVYGLLLMAAEIAMGAALLVGGHAARYGWLGVIAFHLLLLLFGWGAWVWSIPALAVLVPLAMRDLRTSKEPLS
ncbi:hypothetical protein [Nocardioides jensenii]|uniref:hypothetical protein n=1 Tax=Nocardioides jensenii TaxID=1843 RepID=UPI00082FE43E|nr:hypothetical protein [Nocardioides jensenii]